MADLDDPALKERVAALKAIRDQAKDDTERAQASQNSDSNHAVSPDMIKTFARTARIQMRSENDGYRREYLRAFAQRVEVTDSEVRIMGTKSELLRTLVAASSVGSAAIAVRSFVLKWRARRDSNS